MEPERSRRARGVRRSTTSRATRSRAPTSAGKSSRTARADARRRPVRCASSPGAQGPGRALLDDCSSRRHPRAARAAAPRPHVPDAARDPVNETFTSRAPDARTPARDGPRSHTSTTARARLPSKFHRQLHAGDVLGASQTHRRPVIDRLRRFAGRLASPVFPGNDLVVSVRRGPTTGAAHAPVRGGVERVTGQARPGRFFA